MRIVPVGVFSYARVLPGIAPRLPAMLLGSDRHARLLLSVPARRRIAVLCLMPDVVWLRICVQRVVVCVVRGPIVTVCRCVVWGMVQSCCM